MNLYLNSKRALVTASSGGIGLAVARSLASEGATVIINGRAKAGVEEAIAEVSAGLPDANLIPRSEGNRRHHGIRLQRSCVGHQRVVPLR
jgi:3-oxoacyl-[acyl-carrier protein] reductase